MVIISEAEMNVLKLTVSQSSVIYVTDRYDNPGG